MLIHVFTHANGFIESFDLVELQEIVSKTGVVGDYTTREYVELAESLPAIIVSPYQAKMALVHFGMYGAVLNHIKADSTPDAIKVKWEYSDFSSNDPDVLLMLSALGVSEEGKTALFEYAQTVT